MNTCVAKKNAPKNKIYCKSASLDACVKVVAEIYMAGYHFLQLHVITLLEIEIFPNFEKYIL